MDNEFLIITHSKGNVRRFPILRATYGLTGASYLKGEGKRLYQENMHNLNSALKIQAATLSSTHLPKAELS